MTLEIRTDRLTVRLPRDADAARLARLCGEWDVARMTGGVPYPYPPEAAAGWIALQWAARRRREAFRFLIDDHETGAPRLVGGIGVFKRRADEPWELGYWIGTPFAGRGYATEAARATIAWTRAHLRLTHLTAGHFADNPASGRVLEKLGFRATGEDGPVYSLARDARAPHVGMALALATADAA